MQYALTKTPENDEDQFEDVESENDQEESKPSLSHKFQGEKEKYVH